jgi:AraC-like DNA-binding protein
MVALGDVHVARLFYPSLRARRTAALVRRSDPELYQVALTLRGRQGVAQVGREALVGTGEVTVYESSRPYDALALPTDGSTVEGIVVNVPRAMAPLPAARMDRLLAVSLPGATGTGALLARFLHGVIAESAAYEPGEAARLGALVVDLIALFLARHADCVSGTVPSGDQRAALRASVRFFIERHLGDPDLTPATIAAAHHISVRYLHLLFQHEGVPVAAWVRRRRLEQCRRDLADPGLARVPIHAIAARWGPRRPEEFSKAFRAAYGRTPSDYRHCARNGDHGA